MIFILELFLKKLIKKNKESVGQGYQEKWAEKCSASEKGLREKHI